MAEKMIIFTDGACSGNPGPGGWGAILISPLGKVKELGGAEKNTTNNKMELTAAIEALTALTKVKTLSSKEITIYTDSKYVIQGITGWIFGWKKNGWKTSDGKDVSNKELWESLLRVVQENNFKVEWLYIPAHMGFPGNERCDEIAVTFSQGYSADLFQGAKSDYSVSVDQVPSPAAPSEKKSQKIPAVYLSFVDGTLYRDKDWKTCEARVKGRPGAKYKKIERAEEEVETLKKWGLQ